MEIKFHSLIPKTCGPHMLHSTSHFFKQVNIINHFHSRVRFPNPRNKHIIKPLYLIVHTQRTPVDSFLGSNPCNPSWLLQEDRTLHLAQLIPSVSGLEHVSWSIGENIWIKIKFSSTENMVCFKSSRKLKGKLVKHENRARRREYSIQTIAESSEQRYLYFSEERCE